MSSTFTELAAITRLLAGSRRLDRVLAASDVPASAKKALLSDLAQGALSEAAISVAIEALQAGRGDNATESVLGAAIEAALSANNEAFEASLQAASSVIGSSQELRLALTDPSSSDAAKAQLIGDVFGGRAEASAIELLKTFVYVEHGRHVQQRASEVAAIAAARRGNVVADIRTAIEIDEVRRESLVRALEATLGKKVQPLFSVDPSVIGSVAVRVGDDVLDGSIRHRLAEARKAFAGA